MPRVDSITGCQVMTLPELLRSFAEEEGKEAHEIWAKMNEEFEQERKQYEEEMRQTALERIQKEMELETESWESNLKYFQEYPEYEATKWNPKTKEYEYSKVSNDPGPQPPVPVELEKVYYVFLGGGMLSRGSSETICAKIKCEDGLSRIFFLFFESYSGSFYEPPHAEGGVEWMNPEDFETLILAIEEGSLTRDDLGSHGIFDICDSICNEEKGTSLPKSILDIAENRSERIQA